jgi:hypothetical protein
LLSLNLNPQLLRLDLLQFEPAVAEGEPNCLL